MTLAATLGFAAATPPARAQSPPAQQAQPSNPARDAAPRTAGHATVPPPATLDPGRAPTRTTTITPEDRHRLADGENYVVARVDAVINETFDTGAFPFDQHRLAIAIESPFGDDYVDYEVDQESSMLDPAVFSPGWRLVGFTVRETRKQYPTSFGLTERMGARYSTVVAEFVAQRIGWRVGVDYFYVIVMSVVFGRALAGGPA